jgi:hypothetical protein
VLFRLLYLIFARLVGWCWGLGAVFGFLATNVSDVFAGNPNIGGLIAGGAVTRARLEFEFIVTILKIVGIIAACSASRSPSASTPRRSSTAPNRSWPDR